MAQLNKAQRAQCWHDRDAYFECMDLNNDDASKCQKQLKACQDSCPKAWVAHFLKKRNFDKFRQKMEQGFDPIDEPSKAKA